MNLSTRFLIIALISLSLAACQNTASLSDVEKRARIESMYQGYRDDFPGITEVSPADIAEDYRNDKLVIVDVRSPEEQAVSMIPGALTQAQFESQRAAGTLDDKPIVVHCTIGYRSGVYVYKLRSQGIPTQNLKGSILLWTHEGLPLETPEGTPTQKVHTYGKQWDLVAEGYESVW